MGLKKTKRTVAIKGKVERIAQVAFIDKFFSNPRSCVIQASTYQSIVEIVETKKIPVAQGEYVPLIKSSGLPRVINLPNSPSFWKSITVPHIRTAPTRDMMAIRKISCGLVFLAVMCNKYKYLPKGIS